MPEYRHEFALLTRAFCPSSDPSKEKNGTLSVAPKTIQDSPRLPEKDSLPPSLLMKIWLSPFLDNDDVLGYRRPPRSIEGHRIRTHKRWPKQFVCLFSQRRWCLLLTFKAQMVKTIVTKYSILRMHVALVLGHWWFTCRARCANHQISNAVPVLLCLS